jgi:hypothetical protein
MGATDTRRWRDLMITGYLEGIPGRVPITGRNAYLAMGSANGSRPGPPAWPLRKPLRPAALAGTYAMSEPIRKDGMEAALLSCFCQPTANVRASDRVLRVPISALCAPAHDPAPGSPVILHDVAGSPENSLALCIVIQFSSSFPSLALV